MILLLPDLGITPVCSNVIIRRKEMLTTERLCKHMIRLLHAPIHIYNPDRTKKEQYSDRDDQSDLFDCDEAFLASLLAMGREDRPVLYLELEEVIYGIIRDAGVTYILGPCCLGNNSGAAALRLASSHHLRSKSSYRISSTSLNIFSEMVLLLFEHLTGRRIEPDELYRQCFWNSNSEDSLKAKVHEVFYSLHEAECIHNPYSQELREQESIRTGDLDGLYRSFQETFVGRVGILSPDPLRHAKNMDIVLVAISCRSAIAGGLPPEIAFSMSDAFIQRAEELTNIGDAEALGRQAEIEYCTIVSNLTKGGQRNRLIAQCKELIAQRIHTKISVKELADELEITPSYLSHLFIRETGIKLSDYIMREKIETAKKDLIYTDETYEAIAFSYSFATQSHFGAVFKKWLGMTPKQFREKYGKNPQK